MTWKWNKDTFILLFSAMLIALCGLLYELLIGTASSYLLGNSVMQFSFTIGAFMTSFGIGSFLSQYVKGNLIKVFFIIEVVIGFLGSISILALFYFYSVSDLYYYVMYFFIISIGILVALEVPIIGRVIEEIRKNFKVTLANLLSFDYIGSMIGSVAFPLLLLPKVGVLGSSILVGMGNLFIALLVGIRFRKKLSPYLLAVPVVLMIGNVFFFIKADSIQTYIEQRFYDDKIIYQEQSSYQRIVVTREGNDIRLFLDGNIQFSSKDEYRYHEALTHIPIATARLNRPFKVLILGGGDGLAARELLKYPQIKNITICDLDPAITKLAKKHPVFKNLSKNSLLNPKVKVINQDAYVFLEQHLKKKKPKWDFILIDLPDPNNESLAKLYSVMFYKLVLASLTPDGVAVAQSASPFHAREVFWCINETIRKAGALSVLPYHLNVPAFGEWGMNMFSRKKLEVPQKLLIPQKQLAFLNSSSIPALFSFPEDMKMTVVKANTLFRPTILDYYEKSWKYY